MPVWMNCYRLFPRKKQLQQPQTHSKLINGCYRWIGEIGRQGEGISHLCIAGINRFHWNAKEREAVSNVTGFRGENRVSLPMGMEREIWI